MDSTGSEHALLLAAQRIRISLMLDLNILAPALGFSYTLTQESLFLCESGVIVPVPKDQKNCVSIAD